ncbi:hypothetical protein NDU88_005761 [Pleurodeles waltl]|uniref:Transmembrane protein n=1 Tax=Pleurodeles waltl TaxID=8319 RepID=A0AAV7VMN2_PLEWA|nr:hypothetical protein NDU88_005761 [Pleurodeles waltl]
MWHYWRWCRCLIGGSCIGGAVCGFGSGIRDGSIDKSVIVGDNSGSGGIDSVSIVKVVSVVLKWKWWCGIYDGNFGSYVFVALGSFDIYARTAPVVVRFVGNGAAIFVVCFSTGSKIGGDGIDKGTGRDCVIGGECLSSSGSIGI